MKLRILFFLILALEIYASLTQNKTLVYATKPLLMPLLMVIAFRENIKDKPYYVALFFCLLGDVFLMFSGNSNFIFGLSSFLIGHVFYIFLFKTDAKYSLLPTVLILGVTIGYFLFLYPTISQNMLVAVAAYCAVISAMAITAASRTKNASYGNVLIGALLFILSDSLIAFNKFYQNLPYHALYIMSTYGLAQFLILQGWIKKDSLSSI